MASSSEIPSIVEQMAQSTLLNIKANQNLILDLEHTKYDIFLQPLIDFLSYSPLVITLMKIENIPLVHLSKAYLTASYEQGEDMITFEVENKKTQITKPRFCNLLGLPQGRDLVNLESILNSTRLEMFYQMGYREYLAIVSKFKKPNLPHVWNALFTSLFKILSKRVTGSDYTTKFAFIGSIPESMLRYIPTTSEVIQAYRSVSHSGPRPMTDEIRKVLDEVDKPKNGGKQKGKVGPYKPVQTPKKKVKRQHFSLGGFTMMF
ncbi:unnamed protein product [Lactuca saligna]|uniref:Uncharacterized protein n=1 Tax=Lactuca saligna TaxID=75948 RepID=A0AA36E6L3_LACSI|nr:unnamed protein product [Lactuca saligna]